MTKLIAVATAALLIVAASAARAQQRRTGTTPGSSAWPKHEFRVPGNARVLTSAQVEREVREKIATQPIPRGSGVNVSVDVSAVILTGNLECEQKHEIAVRITGSYSGNRRLIDNIRVAG